MDNAIKIGSEIKQESAEYLKEIIETVFRTGAETRMDQKTIRRALGLIEKMVAINGISVSNSNFVGDRHIHVSDETKPTFD